MAKKATPLRLPEPGCANNAIDRYLDPKILEPVTAAMTQEIHSSSQISVELQIAAFVPGRLHVVSPPLG
jgi:hypothetical protein